MSRCELHACSCPQRPEGIRFLRTGVIGGCPLMGVLGAKLRSSVRAVSTLHGAISPVPYLFIINASFSGLFPALRSAAPQSAHMLWDGTVATAFTVALCFTHFCTSTSVYTCTHGAGIINFRSVFFAYGKPDETVTTCAVGEARESRNFSVILEKSSHFP